MDRTVYMYAMSVMPTHTHRNTCRKINLITAKSCRPKVEKFRAVIKPQPHQLCTRNNKQSGRGVTVHSPCPGGTVGTRLLWGEWQETPLLVTMARLWLSWKKHEYDSPFPNTGSPATDRDTWGEDRTLQTGARVHVAIIPVGEMCNWTMLNFCKETLPAYLISADHEETHHLADLLQIVLQLETNINNFSDE